MPENEVLYRAIPKQNQWKEQENRPSSAAFKDSKGVSVDRLGGRNHSKVIKNISSRFSPIAIVSLKVKECNEANVLVKYDPVYLSNLYHTVIRQSDDKIEMTNGTARKLARASIIVYPDDLNSQNQ